MNDGIEEPRRAEYFDAEAQGDGWLSWNLNDKSRARLRMHPTRKHSNLGDNVHGAVTLALIDVSLFAASHQFGSLNAGFSVTLDLGTQFIGGGRIDEPLDAVVEQVRETGRLIFLRGMVVQGPNDEHIVASFSGTIRKASQDKR